jgi:hypothetical protein
MKPAPLTFSFLYRASRQAGLAGLLAVASGCGSFGPEPKGVRPDPASVRKIGVVVNAENLGVSADAKVLGEMAGRIAANLGTWGYPTTAKTGTQNYTHIMEAKVGTVGLGSTPAGFSMKMGDSDPRALNFQKADVVPVDCLLYPPGRPRDRASLFMDFMASGPLKTPPVSVAHTETRDLLIEHIATVCFNLLDDLKAPRTPPAATAGAAGAAVATPAWMPEVRIEVRDKPADPLSLPKPAAPTAPAPSVPAVPAPAAPVLPAAPTLPAPKAAAPAPVPALPAPKLGAPLPAASGKAVPEAAAPAAPAPAAPAIPAAPAAPVPAQKAPEPAVTTETRPDPAEGGRKQMIIHNKGVPVILEFGFERK